MWLTFLVGNEEICCFGLINFFFCFFPLYTYSFRRLDSLSCTHKVYKICTYTIRGERISKLISDADFDIRNFAKVYYRKYITNWDRKKECLTIAEGYNMSMWLKYEFGVENQATTRLCVYTNQHAFIAEPGILFFTFSSKCRTINIFLARKKCFYYPLNLLKWGTFYSSVKWYLVFIKGNYALD